MSTNLPVVRRKYLVAAVVGTIMVFLVGGPLMGEISLTSDLYNTLQHQELPYEMVDCACDRQETSLWNKHSNYSYRASNVENYVLSHTAALGYESRRNPPGCNIWKDPNSTPYHADLQTFFHNLATFSRAQADFPGVDQDIRHLLAESSSDQVCQQLELHPENLTAFFRPGMLSWTSKVGYVEPLLPPMRHPEICYGGNGLLDMNYMVHDFGALCRSIRPTSRTVLIDMGASLDFHGGEQSPAVYLIELYKKFGFRFDHIYAFEITPQEPAQVYEKIPEYLVSAYHWINVAVNPDPTSKLNPFTSILKMFNSNDLVVVKLDVDTASVEIPLAHQILQDPHLLEIIDHFYFEHHVRLGELAPIWRSSMKGTIASSLSLFRALRDKGVASHFWP